MRAEIAVGATAQNGRLVVDGQDISRFTRGFCLTSGVNHITGLELDLAVTKGAKVVADAVVELHPDVHALLLHLGWTPPDASPSPPG